MRSFLGHAERAFKVADGVYNHVCRHTLNKDNLALHGGAYDAQSHGIVYDLPDKLGCDRRDILHIPCRQKMGRNARYDRGREVYRKTQTHRQKENRVKTQKEISFVL